MWLERPPCKKFKNSFGEELVPVASLDDKHNTCHVTVDGSCYVAYLDAGWGFFRTEYIFPELLEVFRGLPPLNDEVEN